MATHTFIPSSFVSDATIQNPDMAYHDTSNTNYASVMLSANNNTAYFGGFNISIPISEEVSTVTVKVKASLYSGAATNCYATLMSASDGVALSDAVTLTETATVYTFTLTASAQTVFSYADTLCIMFETTISVVYNLICVYGAEVIVGTEAQKGRNKIMFGNTVLIDLTSDTATASDVLSGKTFHLASGLQATGAYVPSVNKKTATSSSSTATTLAFTGLTKAPSFFVALPNSSIDRSFTGAKVICFLYDGETTYRLYGSYSSGATSAKVTANSASFTYSSGTLTVKSSNSVYILQGGWNLFYM